MQLSDFWHQIFFVRRALLILSGAAVVESFLNLAVAQTQATFFADLGQGCVGHIALALVMTTMLARGLWLWVRQNTQEALLIDAEGRWLTVYGPKIHESRAAQRAQLLHTDLPLWLSCLLCQTTQFVKELFQCLVFAGVFWTNRALFRWEVCVSFIAYMVLMNHLSYMWAGYGVSMNQQSDRIEGFWRGRLYRDQHMSMAALHRRQKSRWALYWKQRALLLFDHAHQTLNLLLPLILFAPALLSGGVATEQYVLLSQLCYNVLPAGTHFSANRQRWSQGWAAGARLVYCGSWGHSCAEGGSSDSTTSKAASCGGVSSSGTETSGVISAAAV